VPKVVHATEEAGWFGGAELRLWQWALHLLCQLQDLSSDLVAELFPTVLGCMANMQDHVRDGFSLDAVRVKRHLNTPITHRAGAFKREVSFIVQVGFAKHPAIVHATRRDYRLNRTEAWLQRRKVEIRF